MPATLMHAPQWNLPVVPKRDAGLEMMLAQMQNQSSQQAQEMAMMVALAQIAAGRMSSQEQNALARELAKMESGNVDKRLAWEERMRTGDRDWFREDAQRRDALIREEMRQRIDELKISQEPTLAAMKSQREDNQYLRDLLEKREALGSLSSEVAGVERQVDKQTELEARKESLSRKKEYGAGRRAAEAIAEPLANTLNAIVSGARPMDVGENWFGLGRTPEPQQIAATFDKIISEAESKASGKNEDYVAGMAEVLGPLSQAVTSLHENKNVQRNWGGFDFLDEMFRTEENLRNEMRVPLAGATARTARKWSEMYRPDWHLGLEEVQLSKAEEAMQKTGRQRGVAQDIADKARAEGWPSERIYAERMRVRTATQPSAGYAPAALPPKAVPIMVNPATDEEEEERRRREYDAWRYGG